MGINDSYVKDTKEHSGFDRIVFEPSAKKELKITDSHAGFIEEKETELRIGALSQQSSVSNFDTACEELCEIELDKTKGEEGQFVNNFMKIEKQCNLEPESSSKNVQQGFFVERNILHKAIKERKSPDLEPEKSKERNASSGFEIVSVGDNCDSKNVDHEYTLSRLPYEKENVMSGMDIFDSESEGDESNEYMDQNLNDFRIEEDVNANKSSGCQLELSETVDNDITLQLPDIHNANISVEEQKISRPSNESKDEIKILTNAQEGVFNLKDPEENKSEHMILAHDDTKTTIHEGIMENTPECKANENTEQGNDEEINMQNPGQYEGLMCAKEDMASEIGEHNEEPASLFWDPMKGKTPKHDETDIEVATPCDQENMSVDAMVHDDRKSGRDSLQILSIAKIYGDKTLCNEAFQKLSPTHDTLSGNEKSCENMPKTEGNEEIGNTPAELIVYSGKDDLMKEPQIGKAESLTISKECQEKEKISDLDIVRHEIEQGEKVVPENAVTESECTAYKELEDSLKGEIISDFIPADQKKDFVEGNSNNQSEQIMQLNTLEPEGLEALQPQGPLSDKDEQSQAINVESSCIEVITSDIESNIDEVIEGRKVNSDDENEEDPISSRNEQKCTQGEVSDEILNQRATPDLDIEIGEIEDEIENQPNEIAVRKPMNNTNLNDPMPEIKLHVIGNVKEVPTHQEIDLKVFNEQGEKDPEKSLITKALPKVSKKKQKKVKTESNTVIAKPIGLVTPLEKRRKRVNYLEMHTGKLSPVSMIKSEEHKKSSKDEAETDLNKSDGKKKAIIAKNSPTGKIDKHIKNNEKKDTKSHENITQTSLSKVKVKQTDKKIVKVKKDKIKEIIKHNNDANTEERETSDKDASSKIKLTQGDMYSSIKSGRRGKINETPGTKDASKKKATINDSDVKEDANDTALQIPVTKKGSTNELKDSTKDGDKSQDDKSSKRDDSDTINSKRSTRKNPSASEKSKSERNSEFEQDAENSVRNSTTDNNSQVEALKTSVANSSIGNFEIDQDPKRNIVKMKTMQDVTDTTEDNLENGQSLKGNKKEERISKKNAKIVSDELEQGKVASKDDDCHEKTEIQSLRTNQMESKPILGEKDKKLEEKLDIYKGESMELMKDTIRKTLRKLDKSSLKALESKEEVNSSKTHTRLTLEKEAEANQFKSSTKSSFKEKEGTLQTGKNYKIPSKKEPTEELVEIDELEGNKEGQITNKQEASKEEGKSTRRKNAKAGANQKSEKTPTKITEVNDAEEIIEDMQRIQYTQKFADLSPGKSEPSERNRNVKKERNVDTADREHEMDAEDPVTMTSTPKHPSKESLKVDSNKTNKLINKYKQSKSSIVKRLGSVAVFSSRRKRNCRMENEDVLRKTQKKKKVAIKQQMKIDTTANEINSSLMDTEDNNIVKMELELEKASYTKTPQINTTVLPMNEETLLIKATKQNDQKVDKMNVGKAAAKLKRIERPEFVPILSRRLARRGLKSKLTPGQKILKRVISKSSSSKASDKKMFANQIQKQINPILEKMNQEYEKSDSIARLKTTKNKKVSASSKSSNNSDIGTAPPKYRKGELDFLDAAIISRRHGRKCTSKEKEKEEKFKKPVVIKSKIKKDYSVSAEDVSSLIPMTNERRTSSSSTTSNSSEVSITSKIKSIESIGDQSSSSSRSSNGTKSSKKFIDAKNQKTEILDREKGVDKSGSKELPIKKEVSLIFEKKDVHTKTKVLSKKKGLKSSNLLKNKIVDSKTLSSTNIIKVNKKIKMEKEDAGEKMKKKKPKKEVSVTDSIAGSGEKNAKNQEIKEVNMENEQASKKDSMKLKDGYNHENTVVKTTGTPIKRKRKVLKTGQKRRTRNAPSTRSLNIKEENKFKGVSKKTNNAKVSSSNMTKGESATNKDTNAKSDSITDVKSRSDTVMDKDPKKKVTSKNNKPTELLMDDKKERNKKESRYSNEHKTTEDFELKKSDKKIKSSNKAPESLGIAGIKTPNSAKSALSKDQDRNGGKSKQPKKQVSSNNKTKNSNLQKVAKPNKQNCKEESELSKTSLVKQKEKTKKHDTAVEKSSLIKEGKLETTRKNQNKSTEKEDIPEDVTEKLVKKNTSKKLHKPGVKRRTRLAPNTRSINTAGVGGSDTKKVKKAKPVAHKEKNINSETEEEESDPELEPNSKKIKLGSKETLNKTAISSKVEKRKLNDKETAKDDEPIIKHVKVDDDISFDISSLTPQVTKKKLVGKNKSDFKPKITKKNGTSLKTKGGTDKVKKKIRKDKSRRTRMSGSNTRSTSIQL